MRWSVAGPADPAHRPRRPARRSGHRASPFGPTAAARYDSPVKLRRPALIVVALLLGVATALSACGGGPAADSPSAVASRGLELLAAKDVDGLRALTCDAAEEGLLDRIGVPGGFDGELLPGLDMDALLEAVVIDTSGLAVSGETISGETATVTIEGDLRISFNAEMLRPILRQLLESQDRDLSDAQLDALLRTLERAGQDVPMTQVLAFVREDGAWKLCGVR